MREDAMAGVTKVAVLDDYLGIVPHYGDWAGLGPEVETVFFREHLASVEAAAAALAPFHALSLMRERMPLPKHELPLPLQPCASATLHSSSVRNASHSTLLWRVRPVESVAGMSTYDSRFMTPATTTHAQQQMS